MAKSSQHSKIVNNDLESDTSGSSSSEDEDDDSESTIKSSIEKIYSKLEGITFQGAFENRVTMTQIRLLEPTSRPVYEVMDRSTNYLLGEIYDNMKTFNKQVGGKEIWKGITSAGLHCYKLWGTEQSVGHSSTGMYYIPIGGIEVIVTDTLVKYQAIVNITVQENH